MRPSRIQAVDHVILQAPHGADEELRWFYGEVAGLDEVPSTDADPPRLSFKSEHIELRLELRPQPSIDPIPCRVTISVPSLEEVLDALKERSVTVEPVSGLGWTDRRVQVLDPGGNRIEFKQGWPQGAF